MKTFKILLIFFLLQVFCASCRRNRPNLKPGAKCVLQDGYVGYCTVLNKCKYALIDYSNPDWSLDLCSFKILRNPLVCCPNCTELEENPLKFTNQRPHKISDACLELHMDKYPCNQIYEFRDLDNNITCESNKMAFSPVVAGGYDAERKQFPHMALIGYGDDVDKADWMCGGSIITQRYILSAAHCISSPALGEIKYAALGILKRSDDPSFWQIYDITKIIAYPEYKPPSKYHDIALLATGARIRYNEYVLPACLYRGNSLPDEAIATGWGALGHRKPLAEHLQVVKIKKYSDSQCAAAYPIHRHLKGGYDNRTQVCYGDENQINDTCEGDSGGPLQLPAGPKDKAKCLHVIIGVTSYGRSCGYQGSSGMYTRVAAYMPWIERITGRLL